MNKLKNQKGQALVEFAFVAVILLVLVYGVTEFGRAWYYTNSMDDAVRAGARMASELYPVPVTDDTRIQTYVQSHVPSPSAAASRSMSSLRQTRQSSSRLPRLIFS